MIVALSWGAAVDYELAVLRERCGSEPPALAGAGASRAAEHPPLAAPLTQHGGLSAPSVSAVSTRFRRGGLAAGRTPGGRCAEPDNHKGETP